MDSDKQAASGNGGFLNVIFHGLFCFFELDDHILVRVPFISARHSGSMSSKGKHHAGNEQERGGMPCSPQDCASEHVYRAGSWLGETTLQPGYYSLEGVRSGYARFRRDKNLVIQDASPAPHPEGLYAEIRFPYPHKITSIEPLQAPKDNFSGGDVGRLSSETLSLLQVFTYIFEDEDSLRLNPHPWNPNPGGQDFPDQDQDVGGFISLHLFAEPDITLPTGSGHFGHAFPIAIQMFDNVDLQLATSLGTPPDIPITDIPFGTRREEMEDLDIRNARLALLGLFLKRGINLNGAFDVDLPFTNASDAERCAGLIGG